jgi:hypothetical protein
MATTDNLVMTLIIILAIDVIFLLASLAIIDMNPTGHPAGSTFYDYNKGLIKDFDAGGKTINTSQASLQLPSGEDSVSDEGSTFADIFKTGRSWFLDATGLSYLINFLGAPVIFLTMLGLPSIVVFSIGALWWGVTLFLIIAFLLGR